MKQLPFLTNRRRQPLLNDNNSTKKTNCSTLFAALYLGHFVSTIKARRFLFALLLGIIAVLPPTASCQRDTNYAYSHFSSELKNNDIETNFVFGNALKNPLNLYFAVQLGVGYSNFSWNEGSVTGSTAFSIDFLSQLYLENKVLFLPENWYSEFSLGYAKMGASNFGMNYFQVRISPLGYRVALDPLSIIIKSGLAFGVPLNDLRTDENSWSAEIQCGIAGGISLEWQRYALGFNFEYDFTKVSSSCNQSLNNYAFLVSLSYKFAKLGHKR